MAKVNLKDLSFLSGQDGAAVALAVDLKCGPGDFAFDGVEAGFVPAQPIMCNGVFEELTAGASQPVTWTVTIYHDGSLTDSVSGKPLDFVLKTGTFAAATTVDPGGVVWATDVLWGVTKGGITSTVRFNNCRVTATYATAAEANTITLSGTAYGRPGRAQMEVS